jgi:hypothetical protein
MEAVEDDEDAILDKLGECDHRELWWVLRFPLRCSEVPKLVDKQPGSWKVTQDAVRRFVELVEEEEEWGGHPCFHVVTKNKAEKRAEVAEELLEKLRTAPDLRECLASICLDDLLFDERWAISYPRQAFALAVYHALPTSWRSLEVGCSSGGPHTELSLGEQLCLTMQWEKKTLHWSGGEATPFELAMQPFAADAKRWNAVNRKGAPHEFDWKDGLCDLIHGYGSASWATAKEWVRAALASPRLALLLDELIGAAEDRVQGRVAVRALELACAPFVQLQRQLERLENPVTLTVPDDEEELGDWAGKSFEVQLVYDVPTGFAIVAAGENLKMVPWQFMDRAEVEEDLWCRIQGDIVDAETKKPLDGKWGKVRIKAQLPHENTLVEFVDCPEVDWRSRYEVVSERDKRRTRRRGHVPSSGGG